MKIRRILYTQPTIEASTKSHAEKSPATFIGTAEGWLYLAVVLDRYSRAVIG
jgi:hypothetical protein